MAEDTNKTGEPAKADSIKAAINAKLPGGLTADDVIALVSVIPGVNKTKFQAGWRPLLGWLCVGGLAYQFLAQKMLPWAFEVGFAVAGKADAVPTLEPLDGATMTMLYATITTLAGIRTKEKKDGTAKP